MTRQEAIEKFTYRVDGTVDMILVKIIEEIFDDFQSRICENCEYFDRIGACANEESAVYDKLVWDDFGCSKFERKDK